MIFRALLIFAVSGSIAQGPTALTFSDSVARGVAVSVSISRLLAITFALA